MAVAEFEQDLVRRLLHAQHSDLAGLELRDVEGGWDNQQWRLGDELAVRLPRTGRAPGLLRVEQAWLPVLAGRLPLPTPVPVRTGEPSSLFPHTWTVTCWVHGDPADRTPLTNSDAAASLARFLRALHQPAPPDAPVNAERGVPLAGWHARNSTFLDAVADRADLDGVRDTWERAVAAPVWQGAPLWLHGDLHPANIIVKDGSLAGVIDFGEMCAGDPPPISPPPGSCSRPVLRDGSSRPTGTPTKRPSPGPAAGPSYGPWG